MQIGGEHTHPGGPETASWPLLEQGKRKAKRPQHPGQDRHAPWLRHGALGPGQKKRAYQAIRGVSVTTPVVLSVVVIA
jgi:hypothetical protein